MLLPIGLAVGSVLSLINHLDHDKKEKEYNQFKVAVTLNVDDIQSTLEHSLLLGSRDTQTALGRKNAQTVRLFLQGSISPGGSGLEFTEKRVPSFPAEEKPLLSYTDIEGVEKDKFIFVVIEIMEAKSKGDSSKLAITPSVVRSLIEEKPLHNIRFVFTPATLSAAQHAEQLSKLTLTRKQELTKLFVLKTQPSVDVADKNDWRSLNADSKHTEITHPVLLETPVTQITEAHLKGTLKAADQLRNLLLKEAN